MAERVVDVLEVIEVEHQQCAFAAVAADERRLGLELMAEAVAIEQPGQMVVIGEVLEPVLVSLAIGDVLDLREQPQWTAADRDRGCP